MQKANLVSLNYFLILFYNHVFEICSLTLHAISGIMSNIGIFGALQKLKDKTVLINFSLL